MLKFQSVANIQQFPSYSNGPIILATLINVVLLDSAGMVKSIFVIVKL